MDLEDWQFGSLEELAEAVESESFDLAKIYQKCAYEIDIDALIGLKSGRIKPEIGNKEHIKITEYFRVKYLMEEYHEYKKSILNKI